MLVRLKRDSLGIALPAIQLCGLALVIANDHGWGSVAGLAMLIASSLYGWGRSIRHARLIVDTPTARIASAAQGYAELRGRGRRLDGTPLLSPVNHLPVLWYKVVTERRGSDGKWKRAGMVSSDASFLLDDGSGTCAVDPDGADMLIRRKDVFTEGDLRRTQWSIIEADRIYVLGEFATLGSIQPDFDTHARIGELLAEWKRSPAELLARFDLDEDGTLDLNEWELARAQARREVLKAQARMLQTPELHVMRKPAKRLYLISDLDPDRIAHHYRGWAALHAAVFLGAVTTAAWLWQTGTFTP